MVEWQGDGPAANREKSQVELNQARVHGGQIRLQPKDRNQRPNIVQISQI